MKQIPIFAASMLLIIFERLSTHRKRLVRLLRCHCDDTLMAMFRGEPLKLFTVCFMRMLKSIDAREEEIEASGGIGAGKTKKRENKTEKNFSRTENRHTI